MKRFCLLCVACLLGVTAVMAQSAIVKSLKSDVPGQGKVRIYQDPQIEALIGAEYTPSTPNEEQKMIKSTGYRVQLYAGNNTRQAKNEAYEMAAQVQEAFPELKIYTMFNPPRWLCRVGDYRSIEEADAMMRRLRATGQFKEVSIVRDQINIYY
ncbi:MAG: SPOR domain-containing protein [Bacteroides sp.]|nr:SPOR domain-containing protein [Bacteroides sp.]